MSTVASSGARAAKRRDEREARGPGAPDPRRVPGPLRSLLAATLLLGLAWALVTPAFQAPDEPAHYGYVQSLAEDFRLPGAPERRPFSTQQGDASSASNADQVAAQIGARMEWDPEAFAAWQARERERPASERRDGGGPNPAATNPPVPYLLYALAYRLTPGSGFFGHLLTLRLVSVLWLLVTVVAVWLLAGEVFSRDRVRQLAAAGVAALTPMMTFVSASLTPDAMLYAVWSLALWLAFRILRRGLDLRTGVAFFGLVGLACLVKATSYALVPGALFVLAVGLRRARLGSPAAVRIATASLGALLVTAGTWLVTAPLLNRSGTAQISSVAGSATDLRELLSYLWQFYLPRTPLQTEYGFSPSVPTIPVYDIWIKTSWGSFGWLETRFAEPLYVVLAFVTLGLSAAAAAAVWRRWGRGLDRALLGFCALVTLTLLAGLHWTDYHLLKGGSGFIQGRYAFPVIGFFGLGFGAALTLLRPSRRAVAVAVGFAGLLILQLFALGLTLDRFYA